MRALRCLPAGLLGAAVAVGATLAVTVGATPATAAPNFAASLALDPPAGKASTTITATFQLNAPDNVRCRMRVVFRWDDHTLGQKGSDSCTLTVHLRAPKDGRDQGPHTVRAVDLVSRQDASATFTITNGDATPTPTSRATQPTDNQSIDAGPPLPVDTATVNPAAAAPPVPQVASSSSTFTWVALFFGGALLLGGVVILVLVVLRMRRGDGAPDDYGDGAPDDYGEPLPVPVTSPLGGYPTHRLYPSSPEPTQVLGYPRPPEVPR